MSENKESPWDNVCYFCGGTKAMTINDNMHFSDQEREEKLKILFLEQGYILEFYN